MALDVVMVKRLPTPSDFWDALMRIVPRALTPTAAKLRSRAPRGKTGKLSRGFDVRARRISQGLVQGVQAEIGARVPYGHLVAAGHRIVARGPGRRVIGDLEKMGPWGVSRARGIRTSLRRSLKARRLAGAIGFVPGHPFEDQTWQEDRGNVVRLIERLLAQDVTRRAV